MLRRAAPYLAGFLSGLLATAVILLLSSPPRGKPIELQPLPTRQPIKVHVTGAVRTPGVYQLAADAIVEQAIQAAGGATSDAYLAGLNLAESVSDGEQIFVPDKTTVEETGSSGPGQAETETGLLSLNEATEPALERLPGIGPSLAQAIVRYRLEHGPFESVEELTNVPGIGPAKMEAIRDLVYAP